jgi:predicted lipoprotein with Yx(FWY)xxD motif
MANRHRVTFGAAIIVGALAACSGAGGGGGLLYPPVATATPSSTASPALSAAPTSSPTASAAPTTNPTAPATSAPTPTAVPSATPTATAKPTSSPTPTLTATPKPTPSPTPTASPTPVPTSSAPLGTASINGSLTFVTSAQLPVYTFSTDTPGNSTCTGSCLTAWPLVPPPSGTLTAPFTSFKRSDNGKLQLQYNGHPLYTFVADSADTANGDGAPVGSGTFNLAHPLGVATAAPTATPAGGGGFY